MIGPRIGQLMSIWARLFENGLAFSWSYNVGVVVGFFSDMKLSYKWTFRIDQCVCWQFRRNYIYICSNHILFVRFYFNANIWIHLLYFKIYIWYVWKLPWILENVLYLSDMYWLEICCSHSFQFKLHPKMEFNLAWNYIRLQLN